MITGLELARPWFLAALPLLLLLPRARGRALRAAALGFLLVAASGPQIPAPGGSLAVLIDVSESVGDKARAVASELAGEWLGRARTYYFAGEAGAVSGPDAAVHPELRTSATDLSRALQVAAAGGADRVLLLSDGAQSQGDALQSLPRMPVDSLYVEPRPNTGIAGLLVPDRASPGETVEVVAVVTSDVPGRARVSLDDGSGRPSSVEIDLPEGETPVPFQFTVEGDADISLTAIVDVDFEQSPGDDAAVAHIAVATERPVLVIGDPSMANLLRAQGFVVAEGDETSILAPLPYSAVVLRSSAARYTPGQLAVLASFVENGGGLMMTGGPESFGLGGWYRTPVEEVLPVDTDLRTAVDVPLVALVMVLDRSQSMATGNPNRLELAKEGVLGVVEAAYQEDLLGLLAFSDDVEWAFRLRPATERGKREMLAAVLGLGTRGGTILEPAYREAIAALRETDAAIKHVIILSDGKLYDGQDPFGEGTVPDFAEIAAEAASEGITTSTIAVGRSADFARMEGIAAAGGGRYHSALDVSTLPRIFTTEAFTATRSLLRDEPVRPIAHAHPLSPLDGELAPIAAYVASSAKPSAEILLEGRDGEPVLALRRHGLGRTAAFTSDLNGWTGELGTGSELPALLGTVVRWLQARPSTYSATAALEGGELRVVVDAVDNGEYVNGARLTARSGGRSVTLEQVAPGRYEGALPGDAAGGPVLVSEGSEIVARAVPGPGRPEFRRGGDRDLLAALSARTGGESVATPEGYAPNLVRTSTPLWPYLTGGALLLFLAELFLRRFAASGPRRAPGRV